MKKGIDSRFHRKMRCSVFYKNQVFFKQVFLIPTRQIQVYEEVFLLNLQVKYSQIC